MFSQTFFISHPENEGYLKRMCCTNVAAAQSAPCADRICHSLRYVSREDVAAASLSKASSSGGSVRLISKGMGASLDKGASPKPSTK